MSLTVIFDRILGRLRETDYEGGGGGGSDVPDPTSHFDVKTTPTANQKYYADQETSPGMTVTVTLKFDNALVDADATPNGWTHVSTGIYTKTISDPGTVAPQQWSYTPGGVYEERTAVKSSPGRSLSAVYPAYWGIYPGNTVNRDITAVVAALNSQSRRVTANMPTTVVNVPNNTQDDCWMWIVTKGSATATPESFDISMMEEPVSGMAFTSPINGEIDLIGYKAYVSTNKADAGLGFGNVKLTINL
jgi:hypothetical protein